MEDSPTSSLSSRSLDIRRLASAMKIPSLSLGILKKPAPKEPSKLLNCDTFWSHIASEYLNLRDLAVFEFAMSNHSIRQRLCLPYKTAIDDIQGTLCCLLYYALYHRIVVIIFIEY